MSDSNQSFWREVLFKTLPPVLLSLAVFLSTVAYNDRQVEIKKIEIANNFFNEITEDAEPTPEMLDLKEEFIKRVLKEEDSTLIGLMRRAIRLNYENKIKKSGELYANADTPAEKAAALTELGRAIENAQGFQSQEINQAANGHQSEYEEYQQFKKADDLNKKAIQTIEIGHADSAYSQLKNVQTIYPDYPGIKTAIETVKADRDEIVENPEMRKAKAEELKVITLDPVQTQRTEINEQLSLKRSKNQLMRIKQ